MDAALTGHQNRLDPGGDPWYRNTNIPLSAQSQIKVREAIRRMTDSRRQPEVHGGVVAELTMGFWWSLLAPGYHRTLWGPALKKDAFESGTQVTALHSAVEDLLRLRNRIAHHEPIHGRDLLGDYHLLLRTSERISPRLAWWIDSTTTVPSVLAKRP